MTLTLEAFCAAAGLDTQPVGLYDAPEPERFAPLVSLRRCLFDHYEDWQRGATLLFDPAGKGCPGCGYWLTGIGRFPSRQAMVEFLTVKEGLRETHASPDDPAPVLAPFGSGCGLMSSLFPDPTKAQAMIGATDIAMRQCLPPDRLGFTVTVPMLERLLRLDDGHSFLGKHFLGRLKAARLAAG